MIAGITNTDDPITATASVVSNATREPMATL